MTPVREAIVLPALLLTVALLGGVRIADGIRLLPPPLTAVVLALLLVATLVRGNVLVLPAFVRASRTPLENTSGTVVLITLSAATAQAINVVLPESGLLHGLFAIFIFSQLLTMNAAGAGRVGILRGVGVLLGSLFVLRFIVVEALYAPNGGMLHRVVTAIASGVTLGGITYQAHDPATGYLGFLTLLLYLAALLLLPSSTSPVSVTGPTSAAPLTGRTDPELSTPARPELPTTL